MRHWGLLALLLIWAGPAGAAERCADCTVAGGSYHVAAPPGWDGHAPLRLLIYLHGYGSTGQDVMEDPAVAPPAAALGFLLVAPDARDKAWAATGAPAKAAPDGGRDDIGFLRAVLADVRARWPVDDGMVVLGGFSLGGMMTNEMACHAPAGFTAFLPMSGGFWAPLPTGCVAPVALRHLHGAADPTVPLGGRVLRERFHMVPIADGLGLFRATDRCTAPPVSRADIGEQRCTDWGGCAGGSEVQFCLHPGGHELRADWTTAGLRWALTHRR